MWFGKMTTRLKFRQQAVHCLLGTLLSSASMALAADVSPVAPGQAPIPAVTRASRDACLPEFSMPVPAPSYKDAVTDPGVTPPAPSPLTASPADVVPQSPAQSFDFGGNFQSSTLLASSFVPNMVGDLLTPGGSVGTSVRANMVATGSTPINDFLTAFSPLPNAGAASPWSPTLSSGLTTLSLSGLPGYSGTQQVSGFSFTTLQNQDQLFYNSSTLQGNPAGIDVNALVADPNAYLSIPGNLQKLQNIGVDNPAAVNQFVNNAILASTVVPSGGVGPTYTGGTVGVNNSATEGVGTWNYTYDYIPVIIPSQVPGEVASLIPAGGNVGAAPSIALGRQKLSENTSPIPRDRVFINYSYFDNTPLYQGGVNVNRVTPGFEKTFFDGNMSFEMRTPFATTLDSTQNLNGITNTSNAEFGNLTMYLKGLLYQDQTFALSTGLGVTVPTADDFVVRDQTGQTTLTVVDNQSVHLLPFIAGTFTPNNRFFAQAMMQIDVDANGNPVSVSQFNGTTFTGNLSGIGRGYDYTYMYLDFNTGYWVYQNPGSGRLVTGVAPIAELHLNQTVGGANTVAGNVSNVNWAFYSSGAITQVNGLVGATAILRDRSTLTAAYCTPLSGDQGFDGEFRLSFNWFFGNSLPTSRLYRTTAF